MTTAEKLLLLKSDFDEVYNAGYENGRAEGGSDSYYDEFWTTILPNNGECVCDSLFAANWWTANIFKPPYNIVPTSAKNMFYGASYLRGDLVEHLKTFNVSIDFSKCTTLRSCFYGIGVTRLGVIDMRAVTSVDGVTYVFNTGGGSRLETIDKIILSDTYDIVNSFVNCTKLKNLTVEGTIRADFPISGCPLTVDSMKSIITHLANHAGTSNEFKCTVTFKATCWEALDAEGATSPNNNTWREYVNDLGWNVG